MTYSMTEIFLFYLTTCAFVCVIVGLLLVYRYFLGNRLTAQANKLKSQIANLKQTYPELQENRSSLVASGISNLGIEGIMDELGIDPGLLRNPLVKGLIDKYAPKLIERLSKEGTNEQQTPKGFM
jgi:hypothetical protein